MIFCFTFCLLLLPVISMHSPELEDDDTFHHSCKPTYESFLALTWYPACVIYTRHAVHPILKVVWNASDRIKYHAHVNEGLWLYMMLHRFNTKKGYVLVILMNNTITTAFVFFHKNKLKILLELRSRIWKMFHYRAQT